MDDQQYQNSEMQACIDDCNECQQICFQTAMTQNDMQEDGEPVDQENFRFLINCADICQTAARFMLSNSPLHAVVCNACAEVCNSCAESCEEIGGMDECVQACRRCAESCEDMAKSYGDYVGILSSDDATISPPM